MTNRSPDNLPEVTGVILAGGLSSRMGSNKALLPYRSGRFIESIHRQLASLFGEVLVVANNPGLYDFLGCRIVPDLHPGLGVLAGLHAGLSASRSRHIFAVACDMPYLNGRLIAELVSRRESADVIIPEGDKGLEPLHAVYGRACLPHMEAALLDNRRRVISFFPEVRVLHSVSGPFDLIAIVAAASIGELDALIDRIGGLDGVERTTSAIVLSTRIQR